MLFSLTAEQLIDWFGRFTNTILLFAWVLVLFFYRVNGGGGKGEGGGGAACSMHTHLHAVARFGRKWPCCCRLRTS